MQDGTTALRVHAVVGSRTAMLVDTAMRGYDWLVQDAINCVQAQMRPVRWIVNTHAHHDHMGLNALAQEQTGAMIASHPWGRQWIADPEANYRGFVLQFPDLVSDTAEFRREVYGTLGKGTRMDLGISGGEHFYLGDVDVEVIDTSGHVPGEIGLLVTEAEQTLILGDVLVGLDLPFFHGYVQPSVYRRSLGRIYDLLDSGRVTRVLTSHLAPLAGPESALRAIRERVEEVGAIEGIILDMLSQKERTLRDLWMAVSRHKQKQPEFRGLAMVAGHLQELCAKGRINENSGMYSCP